MTIDVQELLRELVSQHGPHCFRAHVLGQGYVNDGTNPDTRADFDRAYREAADREIDNMTYAPAYAEPGYTQPANGVLLANWNNLPSQAETALEAAGYAIEWHDEWTCCDDCSRAYRTEPDSYWWQPAGQSFESDREFLSLCVDCLQEWAIANRPDEDDDDDRQVTA